jgi:NAD(P)-dependent dehydrogenase (short-subunit alcohol dehydrogenase family)
VDLERVNNVLAGRIVAEHLPGVLRHRASNPDQSDVESSANHGKDLPLPRSGQTAELNDTLVVLASGLATHTTGGTIVLDGGLPQPNR